MVITRVARWKVGEYRWKVGEYTLGRMETCKTETGKMETCMVRGSNGMQMAVMRMAVLNTMST
jgi:hypothetical protein